jgi:hypothetical protein
MDRPLSRNFRESVTMIVGLMGFGTGTWTESAKPETSSVMRHMV